MVGCVRSCRHNFSITFVQDNVRLDLVVSAHFSQTVLSIQPVTCTLSLRLLIFSVLQYSEVSLLWRASKKYLIPWTKVVIHQLQIWHQPVQGFCSNQIMSVTSREREMFSETLKMLIKHFPSSHYKGNRHLKGYWAHCWTMTNKHTSFFSIVRLLW